MRQLFVPALRQCGYATLPTAMSLCTPSVKNEIYLLRDYRPTLGVLGEISHSEATEFVVF